MWWNDRSCLNRLCPDKNLELVNDSVGGKSCKGLFKIKNTFQAILKAVLTTVYSALDLVFEAIPELAFGMCLMLSGLWCWRVVLIR